MLMNPTPRDWPEDFSHENGNYWNEWVICHGVFVGHKRRCICKVCDNEAKAKWEAMSPEERVAHAEKRLEEMRTFMARDREP